ncbi:apolipoprotein A1/A4/E domain-containing protein [Ruminococcus sp. HUN007]|uniref:apolipoprotein A1/A4/E domain-containing protein n=1 Tax=Ruminococcus sp. HUN007 TaxID=1514668 RepID=UPI0005D29EB8|nr:apolipoprotein A1/A4/E domain-containing protein [Ruminococcus sp. HUN007]
MSAQTVILNRKLENMRGQFKKNLAAMDEIRSEYEKSLNDRLAQVQQEMKEKLADHDASLRGEFETELEKYTAALNDELGKKIDEISSEYAKLKAENDEMQVLMKKTEKELAGEISGLSGKLEKREETMKNEARRRMENVYDEFQKFSEKYPHESFEPGAADALLMQLESVKSDFRAGFYESCMALSSGTGFQIALMDERMKKNMEQWIRYYTQLESYTALVNDFLISDEFCRVKTDSFEKELVRTSEREAETFDFWCENRFSPAAEKAKSFAEFTEKIHECEGRTREEKITSFLKSERRQGRSVSFEELSENLDSLTALHKEICTMRSYIHTGFAASFERAADLSKKIINYMKTERCCDIVSKGFRDGDIRKEYIIEAAEPGKKITVCIFPVCPDRTTVINAAGVYFEHNGSGTPENLKATEKNFLTGLQSVTGQLTVIAESNCEKEFSDTDTVLNELKNRADEQRRKELALNRRRMIR